MLSTAKPPEERIILDILFHIIKSTTLSAYNTNTTIRARFAFPTSKRKRERKMERGINRV